MTESQDRFIFLGARNRPCIGEDCYPWRAELNQVVLTQSAHRRGKSSLIRAIEKLHPGACARPGGYPPQLTVGDEFLWDWTIMVRPGHDFNLTFSVELVVRIQTWLTKHPEWRVLLSPNLTFADALFIYWDTPALPVDYEHLTIEEYIARTHGGVMQRLDGSEVNGGEILEEFERFFGQS